jgi:hypothetical protein
MDSDNSRHPGKILIRHRIGAPEVVAAYARFLDAQGDEEQCAPGHDRSDVVRRKWEAIADALRNYSRADPTMPFPQEIALYVADAIFDVLAGSRPEEWKYLKRPHGPNARSIEQSAARASACYVAACREGLIDDPSPNRTIRHHFNVAASTVNSWCRQTPGMSPAWVEASSPTERADVIRKVMEWYAERYQKSHASRSARSIGKRPKKRLR